MKDDITGEKQVDGRFQKGQSGNPLGRPKGRFSIKTKIIQRLEENPEELEQMIGYLIKNQQGLVFQMIDGRPRQNISQENQGLPVPILFNLPQELVDRYQLKNSGAIVEVLDTGV